MRSAKFSASALATLLLFSPSAATPSFGQFSADAVSSALAKTAPRDRVVLPVDDNDRVELPGNTLPQALVAYEAGVPDGGRRLEHMLLSLKPDTAQQAALDALTEAQQDPKSPLYHQWLTPEGYAEHFGASSSDIEQVQNWLERSGLQIDEVAPNHRTLVFSGTVTQVENAFQTSIRSYSFAGKRHIANASDPMIPAALSGVVGGVVSLNDVFSTPQHSAVKVSPQFSSGTSHYLSPADYAVIYDIASLYSQAYTGSGETIAIVGRSDISLTDVRKLRSQFGLVAKDPVVIVNGADPGSSVGGDVDEAMLDVEWSGAVANAATVDFVTSASTATSDGVFLSAQYIVNHNVAPVMSVSYGLCESSLGASANSFLSSLWQQAASEGITVLVSAGDSGAAGCDASSATKGTHGRGVNGICSTPYSTCVGGTEFNEGANAAQFWNSATGATGLSVLSYIPETTWNESGTSGLWSTGGGVSTVYAKPSWQTGTGVPADGKRDVPDVSMTAAGHDAYLVQVNGALYAFSGTSAASPSFAGVMALVAQKTGARLGNINPELYSLAASNKSIFHDVTSGNNTVPGVTGFIAGTGYDQATGLGSVDAEKLLAGWGPTTAPALSFTLSVSKSTVEMAKAGVSVTLTTAISGGFKSAVALSASGLPTGCTASFAPATIASPGSGSSTLKLICGATAPAGSSTLTVTASGGGVVKTTSIALSIPGLTLTATPAATSLVRAATLSIAITASPEDGFNSALTFTVTGLPAGVTAKFSPTTIAAPGSGSTTLTLSASKTATIGVAKVTITVSGGGYSYPVVVPFAVVATAGAVSVHRL